MRCIIPAPNIKGNVYGSDLTKPDPNPPFLFFCVCEIVFVRALHALARIGDDLYLDSQVDGLALRTTNVSRSAFASFLFHRSFFVDYLDQNQLNDLEPPDDEGVDDDADPNQPVVAKCKITMKVRLYKLRCR